MVASPYAGMYLGAGGRDSHGHPITGIAILRPSNPQGMTFGPWGNWYPWYSTGLNWSTGYVLFDPWQYGTTQWVFGQYGMWPYDPYYDPYYYPYGYAPYMGGSAPSSEITERGETGSVRLRIDPATAQVYIDGVLHGSVADFNGLTSHLEIAAGSHLLEVKADGYATYSTQITVEAGKTVTYRASLKKK